MPFGNPILGGSGALIREAIRSPNYVPGSTGWTINRDGTVEFASGVFRGSITGATGVFSGTVSASNITAGTLTATVTLAGILRTAASGARVVIDSSGIGAFNASGTQTVAISAVTGSVAILGNFATGAAGGGQAYLTIDDAIDRSTIAFWNSAGTNDAFINSPQSSGVPTLGLNSGVYTLTGPLVSGYSRLWLNTNQVRLETVRSSDQSAVGGNVLLTPSSGSRLRHSVAGSPNQGGQVYVDATTVTLAIDNASSVATGGRVRVSSAEGNLEYASAGTGQHGVRVASDGVHVFGTYVSDIGWSASPGSGFSITEFEMVKCAGLVCLNAQVQRTGADIVPDASGNVPDTTMITVTSSGSLPPGTRGNSGETGFGTYGVRFNTGGTITVTSGTTTFATGHTLKFGFTYFVG